MKRPNFIVILIDDLRYDEFGAGGHPFLVAEAVGL